MKQVLDADYKAIVELKDQLFPGERILETERLGGLTNHTYAVRLDSGKYTFRLPGEGTEELINRHEEKISTELACSLGVDTKLLYFNADTGVKICAYVNDSETMSPQSMRSIENLEAAAKIFHTLHTCGCNTDVPFHVFEMAQEYERFIQQNGGSLFEDFVPIRERVMALKQKVDQQEVKNVPCHNDPLCENWIKDPQRLYLIDWEYAGMNDPMWDLADLSIEADYTQEMDDQLLKAYLGRTPSKEEQLRFNANKIYLDFLWSLWGKTRAPFDGEPMEEYALERYVRLKRNLEKLS